MKKEQPNPEAVKAKNPPMPQAEEAPEAPKKEIKIIDKAIKAPKMKKEPDTVTEVHEYGPKAKAAMK